MGMKGRVSSRGKMCAFSPTSRGDQSRIKAVLSCKSSQWGKQNRKSIIVLDIYVFVCMGVCIHGYMCLCICVSHRYVCVCSHLCMWVYMVCICLYVSIYVCAFICICMYVYVFICLCVYMCVHSSVYVYIFMGVNESHKSSPDSFTTLHFPIYSPLSPSISSFQFWSQSIKLISPFTNGS